MIGNFFHPNFILKRICSFSFSKIVTIFLSIYLSSNCERTFETSDLGLIRGFVKVHPVTAAAMAMDTLVGTANAKICSANS